MTRQSEPAQWVVNFISLWEATESGLTTLVTVIALTVLFATGKIDSAAEWAVAGAGGAGGILYGLVPQSRSTKRQSSSQTEINIEEDSVSYSYNPTNYNPTNYNPTSYNPTSYNPTNIAPYHLDREQPYQLVSPDDED